MIVLAIDPGTTESAYVGWDGERVTIHGKKLNDEVIGIIQMATHEGDPVVIEMIKSYGMAVGQEVFETCVWIGRFMEATNFEMGPLAERITRGEVKMHLCHSMKAKDTNVRQALVDRFGKPGTKKNPGVLFGIVDDQWAALALAVTWMDRWRAFEQCRIVNEEAVPY